MTFFLEKDIKSYTVKTLNKAKPLNLNKMLSFIQIQYRFLYKFH